MSPLSYTHAGFLLLFEELQLGLSKPLARLLAWVMVALLEKTQAHLFRLAEKLPEDDTQDRARQQRLRRLLSNPRLSPARFVGPLVHLLAPLMRSLGVLVLSLDRTEWVRRGVAVQVLSVALAYEGRAIPLYWEVKNCQGCTNLAAWKAVLTPVLEALRAAPWAQGKEIHVVGDREFASPKVSEWLWTTFRVGSTLRVKRSEYLTTELAQTPASAYLRTLQPGQQRILRQVTVTKSSAFRLNVVLSWGKGYEEPWILMTTCPTLPAAVRRYTQRWGSEPMHKDWKTNAFDLEGTRVTDAKRIATLLIPIALCQALCVLEGARKEAAGETTHAHKHQRTTGLFLEGLASFTRILRAATWRRIQAFFQRLFKGWLWPWKLEALTQSQKC